VQIGGIIIGCDVCFCPNLMGHREETTEEAMDVRYLIKILYQKNDVTVGL